ncbi:hypothetical protein [Reichenbachiella sp.]|uniref:hypothetical protein n=1 Tax=Reichenbachiella sp. TaxID=2184521 RepID=UPI003BAFA228
MNRRLHLPLLCVLSIACLFGCMSEDSNSLDQSEIFIKYYGSESEEKAIDLLELSDGFLLLGSRTDVDNSDYYLVRTDTAGNRLWEGVINNDDTTGTIDIPSKMYLDETNQKVFIVGTSSFDRDDDNLDKILVDHLFLVDVDISSTGFTVSNSLVYRYFDSRSSSDLNYVPQYKETSGADVLLSGDDLIVLGSVVAGSNDPADADNSILLMKISRDFATTDWERIKGFSEDDFGKSLLEADGRYFYMASITSSGSIGVGLVDVMVEEFNIVSGNEDNKVEYGTTDNDEATNIVYTNPGIAIVGTTGSGSSQFAFLIRTTRGLGVADIEPLTYPRSTSENWNTVGSDVVQTSSGDYFVVGNVNSFSDADADPREDEILLIRTNGVGEVYEEEVQEYGSVQSDAGNAIIRRADGTMVIAATVHFGGSATMMSLMKTNKNGEFLKN